MKLAFSGKAKYHDYSEGYGLYLRRSKKGAVLDKADYSRVIRRYCGRLAERLNDEGIVDLPNSMGSIAASTITRKAQYRGDKFIGYGKMDWSKGHYDAKLKTFGIVFIPNRNVNPNLRCFGFVANRQLFKKVKETSESSFCEWIPMEFKDDMI